MLVQAIHTLFEYTFWSFDRVWSCIDQLTDEQFGEDIPYSVGSIRNQLIHIMSGTTRWIYRVKQEPVPDHLHYENYSQILETKQKWEEMRTGVLQYIHTLDEEALEETIHWELLGRGLSHDNRRWQILMHVANHATDHRSQILMLLNRKFNIDTTEQDLLFYLSR